MFDQFDGAHDWKSCQTFPGTLTDEEGMVYLQCIKTFKNENLCSLFFILYIKECFYPLHGALFYSLHITKSFIIMTRLT